MLQISLLMVFLSGLTGLVYQVTWQKYLSILLGSHASATSIVLALFFFFLSIGYSVIGKYSFKLHRNHLLQYGILELFIGLYALYSPAIFRLIFDRYSNYQSSYESEYLLGLLYSGLFIFIPTFLMGGTIPVLVQALSGSYNMSSKIHARIYSVNTLGAFLGCVLSGFWLIERLGIEDTLFIAAWINLFIALIIFGIVGSSKETFSGPAPTAEDDSRIESEKFKLLGLTTISFLSGFYIFTLEKLTIRMSGMVYGSSTYTFSIVVGAFILSIGVGSYLLSLLEKRLNAKTFIITLFLSLASLIALYLFVPVWPEYSFRIRSLFHPALINFMPYWIANLNFALFIFLVPIGILGTNLPFLFSLLKKENRYLSHMVGRLYSVNCVGATLGAIVGGYWFFKFFEAYQVFKISVLLLIIAALIALFVLGLSSLFRLTSGIVLAFVLVAVLFLPPWKTNDFVPGRHLFSVVPADATDLSILKNLTGIKEILFAKYDPNTHVTVTLDDKKNRVLYVNGKPDASTGGDHATRALAALTPIALSNRKVENIFIAGLGAGLSTAVATKFNEVRSVDVAEISEGVKDALPYFKDFNLGLHERTEKYQVEVGDAYKILMSKNKKYDLIICEPSNPWVTGVEKLFSTEFYQQVNLHLHEDGIFAQWFPLFSMDESTFLTILNTYAKEFKWVSVWGAGNSNALTILGSQTEFEPSFEKVKSRFSEQKEMYNRFNIQSPESIYYYQLLTPAQVKLLLLKVQDVNSVFFPILELKAGRGHFAGLNVNLSRLLEKKAFLPFPKELTNDIWPFWHTQKIPYEHSSFQQVESSFKNSQLQIIRQYLLYGDDLNFKKNNKDMSAAQDHLFLLGRSNIDPTFKKGETLLMKVNELSAKVRQLNAIGFNSKLSQLVGYIEKNCTVENCLQAKYVFLSWLTTPEKWSRVFSFFDIGDLSLDQKAQIESEYTNIKEIYRSVGSY